MMMMSKIGRLIDMHVTGHKRCMILIEDEIEGEDNKE
jgi:hypothetical protein